MEAGKEKLGKVGMLGVKAVRMNRKIPEGYTQDKNWGFPFYAVIHLHLVSRQLCHWNCTLLG